MKNSIKAALQSSLKNEEQHIEERFSKADSILSSTADRNTTPSKTKPVVQVVRDTFSMPQEDNELINEIRLRCMRAGIDTTRSEIVRAGIRHLSRLSQDDLEHIIGKVEKLKPGPQKGVSNAT